MGISESTRKTKKWVALLLVCCYFFLGEEQLDSTNGKLVVGVGGLDISDPLTKRDCYIHGTPKKKKKNKPPGSKCNQFTNWQLGQTGHVDEFLYVVPWLSFIKIARIETCRCFFSAQRFFFSFFYSTSTCPRGANFFTCQLKKVCAFFEKKHNCKYVSTPKSSIDTQNR